MPMKTPFITSIIILGLSLASYAQDHHRPHHSGSGNPDFHQMRGKQGRPHHDVDPRERQQHLREALRHLQAAGLPDVAERIENMMQSRFRPEGSRSDGPRQGPRPEGPHKRETARDHSSDKPQHGNNDDLRAQMQRLSHQVEQLGNIVRKLAAESHRPPHAGKQSYEQSKEKCEDKGKCKQGSKCKEDCDEDQERGKEKEKKKERDGDRDKGRDRDKRSETDSDSDSKPAILPAPEFIS